MRNLTLIMALFIFSSLSGELVKLKLEPPIVTAYGDEWVEGVSQKTINIAEGDTWTLINQIDKASNSYHSRLAGYTLDWDNDGQIDFSASGASVSDTFDLATIVGPATLVIKSSIWSGGLYVCYEYTRASSTIYSGNVATIPAIANGSWNVELEYSQDLINWSSVIPGTATGSNELQFYRVKVTESGD